MPLGWMPEAERIYGLTKYSPGGINKVGICSHTAGGYLSTMRDPNFWNVSVKCSVHFAIGRRGEIIQLINIFDRAWGQGILNQVSWPAYDDMGYLNPNEYLISIEREDAEGGRLGLQDWPEPQYQALLKVHKWCREEVAYVKNVELLHFGIDSLAGHYMFDAINRVNCPGTVWRNEIRPRLYNDLTQPTVEVRNKDGMKIIHDHTGAAYLAYEAQLAWIPNGDIYNDLVPLIYGNAPHQVTLETWNWLQAGIDKQTGQPTNPPQGARFVRIF